MDNIKVHFVYAGQKDEKIALDSAGVRYRLFSCYDFIVNKKLGDDFRLPKSSLLKKDIEQAKHVIMDSGLFTFMFGAGKGQDMSFEQHEIWQNKMIEFVNQNELDCTVVEMDCQKTLGAEEAWYFKQKLKEALPNNRIINVFHMEDGREGLDKLIEFSDFIAISVPELRIHKKGTYRKDTFMLAKYIKTKKPDIDIHLLGCTESNMIRQNRFCTTCDSSSWISPMSYGWVDGKYHIDKHFKDEPLEKFIKQTEQMAKDLDVQMADTLIDYTAKLSLSAKHYLDKYAKAAGDQS